MAGQVVNTSVRWLAKGAFVAGIGGASGFIVHAVASRNDASSPSPSPSSPRVADQERRSAVPALPALQLPTALPDDRTPRLKLDPRLEEAELLEQARSLLAVGNVAAARERARVGLSRYPNGAYARQLREIVDAP